LSLSSQPSTVYFPSKTDSKDAFTLAFFALKNPELLRAGSIPEEVKIIARTIQSLKKELAQTQTKILNCLCVVFPELEKVANPFSKTILNILLYFPSAKDIAKAPIKTYIQKLLSSVYAMKVDGFNSS
ncbi:MAG: hypothetical protein ACP5JK_03080, partial [Candidatus Aenigmatarchaeota archaeon]